MVRNAGAIYILLSSEVLQVLPTFTNVPIYIYIYIYSENEKKKGKLLLYVDQSRPISFAVRTNFKHVSSYRVFSKLLNVSKR